MATNTSQVNTAFPRDNEQVSKAEMRQQFQIISNEITALLQRTSYARKIAFGELSL